MSLRNLDLFVFKKGQEIQFIITKVKVSWDMLNESILCSVVPLNPLILTLIHITVAVPKPAKMGQCATTLTCNAAEEAAG